MAEIIEDIITDEFQQEDPKPGLRGKDRAKLDSIVQLMVKNNESDEDIRFIIEDFKKKYAVPDPKLPSSVPQVDFNKSFMGMVPTLSGEPTVTPAQVIDNSPLKKKAQKSLNMLAQELQAPENDAARERLIKELKYQDYQSKMPMPASDMPQTGSAQTALRLVPELANPKAQDFPVAPEEVQQRKEADLNDEASGRGFFKHIAKENPEKGKKIQAALYEVDTFRALPDDEKSVKRLGKIQENSKKIEEGKLKYDPETGMLYEPQGPIKSGLGGWRQKTKGFNDFDLLTFGKKEDILQEYEKRREDHDPDKPLEMPEGKLAELAQMAGGTPLKPIVAGLIPAAIPGGQALAAPISAAVGAEEYYRLGVPQAFDRIYNELRDKGLSPSEAYDQAMPAAKKSGLADAGNAAIMTTIGSRIGMRSIPKSAVTPGFKSAALEYMKKELGRDAAEALAGSATGSITEAGKNWLAQQAGSSRQLDEGVEAAAVDNLIFTGAMIAAAKGGKALSKINHKRILNGLGKVADAQIDSNIKELLESGAITEKEAETAKADIAAYKETDSKIPENVSEEARLKIQDKIKRRDELDTKLENTDKAFHPEIKEQIKKIEEEINELAQDKVKLPKENKKVIDAIESAIEEGKLQDIMATMARQEPEEFMKMVADQAHGRTATGEMSDIANAEYAVRDQYGDTIVDVAMEMFPMEQLKKPSISVIRPEQNQNTGEVITIKPNEDARNTVSETEAMVVNEQGAPEGSESVVEPVAETEGAAVTPVQEKAATKELDKLANNIPDSGKVAEYMSKDTIEKYTGETPLNDQTRGVQELDIALKHGEKIIEKAKESFGDDYVEKTIDYIDNSTAGVSNKALMYVSLENALGREKLANPERAGDIAKQQALVYAKSQAFARENSLALNYQKLRKIAKVGYDIDKVTESFFSPQEREAKKIVQKAIEADADAINKQAETLEAEGMSPEIEKAVNEGVAKEIDKIYKALPKDKKSIADRAIAALDKLHDKLRNKTYEGTLGVPVAIIDGAVVTIKNAIKAGVAIADAVELGIAKIKEKVKDWGNEAEFRKDVLEGLKWAVDSEAQQKRRAAKEYRMLETERNRQLKRVQDLTEQLKELESGKRPIPKDKEPVKDTPEIEALKESIKQASKNLSELDAQQKRIDALEAELDRLQKRLPKEKTAKAKRDVGEKEQELLDEIEKEKETIRSEQIDSDYVKQALIERGFGREVNIKGEKKTILDWKKLAGEAGTVSKISENVGKALQQDGFTEARLDKIRESFIEQYIDLRASVIQKSQTELAARNKETVSPEQKSAAKKLAELYTYGLFDAQPETFENTLNKALGVKVSPEGFAEARDIAKSLETLYSSSFKGQKLNDTSAKVAIEQLQDKMRQLLFKEAKKQGNFNLRAAQIVRNYFEIQQTMLLNNLKQAVENPLSGLQQNVIDKITGLTSKEGIGTGEMANERRTLMKDVFKDMVLNGAIGYGKTESAFVNRTHLDDYLNKLSDHKLYHAIMSVATGRTTLNAMDAMYKAGITEKKFASNLIKVLTHPTNPNKMGKADAVAFVSEKLTGQTLADARVTAKDIIQKINKDAGKDLVPETPESINRFANDIVKSALEMGGKITTDQITAAYNAAYKAAGLGLGHEANNILSSMISGYSANIEKRINDSIRNKEWNRAAMLTAQSIFFRNVLNPFVGGGTNWLILKLEKAGLGLVTGLGYKIGSNTKLDLSSDVGVKEMETRLYNQARVKDNFMRGLVGGAASLLTWGAFEGLTSDEDYNKWRGKNEWATKYVDIATSEYILAKTAIERKEAKRYVAGAINKNDHFDASTKLIKGADYAVKGKTNEAIGALGEVIGSKFNTPLPWKLVKDGKAIYDGVTGKDPYHGDYEPSTGFLNGVFRGGAIEWIGLRPEGAGKTKTKKKKSKSE